MSVKGDWILKFEKLLLEKYPSINKNNSDYAYQLATAYFDWDNIENKPDSSVEEAIQRYEDNCNEH